MDRTMVELSFKEGSHVPHPITLGGFGGFGAFL